MTDYLAELAERAQRRVKKGYYKRGETVRRSHPSLIEAIEDCEKIPIITEIKYASPSSGQIRRFEPPQKIARAMLKGGACALSILADPEDFQGELKIVGEISARVDVPVLMKDIIVSPAQLEAATRAGADVVVLIAELFSRRLSDLSLGQMMAEARKLGLEVLAEANGLREFGMLQKEKPDLYGINNRDLSTFQLELSTTERILAQSKVVDGPVVAESGIDSPTDIRRLRAAGADAFLVGTSVMRASDIEGKVRELATA